MVFSVEYVLSLENVNIGLKKLISIL